MPVKRNTPKSLAAANTIVNGTSTVPSQIVVAFDQRTQELGVNNKLFKSHTEADESAARTNEDAYTDE